MRRYIRHPSDIPIEFEVVDAPFAQTRPLNNISLGGFSFNTSTAIDSGRFVRVRIRVVKPVFEAVCRVAWCKRQNGSYEVGVGFLERDDAFRARMVEQVCHIEHYKKEVLEKEGRAISGEEAALEWIRKYAKDFPLPELQND